MPSARDQITEQIRTVRRHRKKRALTLRSLFERIEIEDVWGDGKLDSGYTERQTVPKTKLILYDKR